MGLCLNKSCDQYQYHSDLLEPKPVIDDCLLLPLRTRFVFSSLKASAADHYSSKHDIFRAFCLHVLNHK